MNLEALKSKIQEFGISKAEIAGKLGISRQSLSLKLSGKRSFKASEANGISDILRLSSTEKTDIFFKNNDDV